MRATAVSLLVLALSALPLRAQKPAAFDARWGETTALFHQLVQTHGIVGASLWFFRGNEVLGREFHGFADFETKRPVDENTIWHWASITKTFTGLAAMQLRDRRLLSLDDPIVRWVPELREVHDPFDSIDRITVRHLLSHSAGFRAGTWPWGGSEPWHPHEPTRWEQLVAMMPYTEVLFEPGSKFSYSNPGIVFVGRAIESITGDDWEVYVDKNILKPLGMHRSYFDVTPYHLLQFRANNYRVVEGEPVANGFDFNTGITVSNGGLNAPVPDMARYLAFLVGGAETEVLSRATLEEMWQPIVDAGEAPDGGREAMGLTWFISERPGFRLIGHTGSQQAFQSFIYLDPATGAAAIGTFNTDDGRTRDVLNQLRAKLIADVFPVFRAAGS